ncbi:ATP-binding protein [Streptomyces sp. NPDC056500]|uniref:ATP-binding protein n=1 Tax=Streptomyces sp. NPDC056500 TaxID=3345840 RepID=UPI0036C14878
MLDSSPEAVGHARAWAAEFLTHSVPDAPAAVADDVVLIVSELVTNAILYGSEQGDSVTAVLDCEPGRVRIDVHDAVRRPPPGRGSRRADNRGRGLFIVAALSSTWGLRSRSVGKTVWAEVTW